MLDWAPPLPPALTYSMQKSNNRYMAGNIYTMSTQGEQTTKLCSLLSIKECTALVFKCLWIALFSITSFHDLDVRLFCYVICVVLVNTQQQNEMHENKITTF